MTENPLLKLWDTPFGAPPFAAIRPDHFMPAFEMTMAENMVEIDAIATNPAPASFANVVDALENAGRSLNRVAAVFFNLSGADTNDELQAIEREIAPKLAAHHAKIATHAGLFARLDAVHAARDSLSLTDEQRRVLERLHVEFVRGGAKLDAAGKARVAEIGQRLAALSTQFSQNVLADEKGWTLELTAPDDLAGLPDALIAAAASAAAERGQPGKYLITLSRSSVEPFLQYSARRDLREIAFRAWTARGASGGATDNKAVVAEILQLRRERARLFGYEDFAAFKLDDTMAKTPDAVNGLLDAVWAPARRKAAEELAALQAMAGTEGLNEPVEAWDWRYYAEKVRRARYDLDEASIKPYLPLERMIEAAFDTASRLFGLTVTERRDIALYHPDVRAWEIARRDGSPVGLFLGDYFARPGKRSGAWMSSFRSQEKLGGDIRPIIVNVMNFSKGDPALLSFDDARTLFHEFGHALHGLLSNVTYPTLAGTAVAGDFVELPSQLYEHWLSTPSVLSRFARHHATGEAMPQAVIERLRAARNFNQGFATVEFLSSAKVDMALHADAAAAAGPGVFDPWAYEKTALAAIGMPREIVMRHRTPHFLHIFAGSGYAAGYYSYMWSEVLDADAFAAFEETGDVFDPATAKRLEQFVYSAGNLREPDAAYVGFRGRLPSVEALLRKRGFTDAAA
jgi:peptidyl-dipeptidase Dcp